MANRSNVSAHYAHRNLIAAIENGVALMGKTTSTITIDDLAPVDEFHIGGRKATEELIQQLGLSSTDQVIDIGSGLGGAARLVADRHHCHVTGIDLTGDYIEAGNVLCTWVGLSSRVSLIHANALSIPFPDGTFSAAYMLHVGMNIQDKIKLFCEVARVIRPGARFGIYDVMRIGDEELEYPVPWATTPDQNALAGPKQYRGALVAAGFKILSVRNRREFALAYFNQLKSKMLAAHGPGPLGMHILMGERRQDQVRNMIQNISMGSIAPFELVARRT